jgi:hypothetical protein
MQAGARHGDAIQFLDLLLDFFADGTRWTKGQFRDSRGRRCLVGAIHYLRARHSMPSATAERFLEEALPRPCRELVMFNDLFMFNDLCRSVTEVRALIVEARALAVADAEQCRKRAAAAQLNRWLILTRLERERAARAAAGDERATYILCPEPPAKERLAA